MIKKNNKLLTKNVKHRKSLLSKAMGLMFSNKKNRIEVFHFDNYERISLHLLFVFYTINVACLDKKGVVKEVAELKPFSFYKTREKCSVLLEYPKNYFDIKIGDKLEIYK